MKNNTSPKIAYVVGEPGDVPQQPASLETLWLADDNQDPKKNPEVEPEKLPKEDPGIQPDTTPKKDDDDDNDDDDDDYEPYTEPEIGDDPGEIKKRTTIM